MFRTYKDILFWSYIALWMTIATLSLILLSLPIAELVSLVFMILLSFITLTKVSCSKFAVWLETPLKNNGSSTNSK